MISSEYSLWFIALCILLASTYTYFFYRKDKQFFETKQWKIYLLASFRFISVFLISFLLLSPMLKSISDEIEKPILVFAQDNSESIVNYSDSAYIKKDFNNELETRFFETAGSDFDIVKYSFGEELKQQDSFSFAEKETNMSDLFEEIQVRYENRNLGAIIIASDGTYNKGKNPIYSITNSKTPIYTIALGDTSVKKDALISDVKANKIAFLGNKFPIRIELSANKLIDKQTELRISNNAKVLFSKLIKISSNNYTETVDAELIAKKKGLQQFHISLKTVAGEIVTKNNRKTIVVDVLDNKQKILILANSPHPDLGAIRSVLEKQQNYETTVSLISNKKINTKAYDLVIFHQLPSKKNKIPKILSIIKKENIPSLFVLGAQSDLKAFNSFNSDSEIKVKQHKNTFEESSASVNQDFKLFEISEQVRNFIESSAPLLTHFASYELPAESEILFYQRIKNIVTKKPLLLFLKTNEDKQKSAILLGEGLWRWRLADYNSNESHEHFDEIFGKIVQYLALKVKKERFIIKTERIFTENRQVKFEAQVYNESYEAISDAVVSLQIKDSENRIYEYSFNSPETEKDKAYYLNAGILPIGEYSYSAKAEIQKETFKKTGNFLVVPLDVEMANLTANHKTLHQLASQSGGKVFYSNNLDSISIEIAKNNKIIPVYHSSEQLLSLINLKWIFFLIVTLLSVEWFLRKFYGSFM